MRWQAPDVQDRNWKHRLKMANDSITKISVYTPEAPETPITRLTSALNGDIDVSGSLLVLPEAFNIGTSYSCCYTIQKDPRILCELQRLCCSFNISIVAGLIISGPADQGVYPYSSAYLINAHGATLLSHKMNSDSQGPYTACPNGCDGHNASIYRNIALCSLICMDAFVCYGRERHDQLEKKLLAAQNVQYRIVCVPCNSAKPKAFWELPNSYRVVANADKSAGSFVEKLDNGKVERMRASEETGCISLYHLP